MKFATIAAITFGAVSCYAGGLGGLGGRVLGSQCNNGPIQCCNELKSYNELNAKLASTVSNFIGGSLEKVLQGQFGITCTSVGVAGAAGNQCSQQSVCCDDVEQNSLIGINCTPINLNG